MKRIYLIASLLIMVVSCGADNPNTGLPDQGDEKKKNPETPAETISATLNISDQFGCKTRYLFYDIKDGKSVSDKGASLLFGDEGMNGIRVPIYGIVKDNGTVVGHPSAGVVIEKDYAKVISSIKTARTYCPNLMVFASKKINGTNSFADWLKIDGVLDSGKYTGMIMDFLIYMKSQDIEIDILGIDNETNFNEGGITPAKYAEIVTLLKVAIKEEGLKMPLFIGPERYNPQAYKSGSWLYDLMSLPEQAQHLDIYGTHYYPRHHIFSMNGNLKAEVEFSANAGKPFWATEAHWDSDEAAQIDLLGYARMAICTLWDQTDLGLEALMWWGYPQQITDMRGSLMHDISSVIYGSRPVRIIDHDGEATMGTKDYTGKWTDAKTKPNNDPIFDNNLHSRAFIRNGNEINVYFINVHCLEDASLSKDYEGYTVKINGAVIDGQVSFRTWSDTSPITGISGTLEDSGASSFSVDLPARSITRVSFKVKK